MDNDYELDYYEDGLHPPTYSLPSLDQPTHLTLTRTSTLEHAILHASGFQQ